MTISLRHVNEFATELYTHVTGVISKPEYTTLFEYAVARSQSGTMNPDTRVPGTPAAYADPRMEDILERLTTVIEQIAQESLFPTYSYFRVYKTGDVLERHTDRESCEITVSINLGHIGSSPWPLWVDGPRMRSGVELKAGDALVYRGIECPHWREQFAGELAAQAFLHYVFQNGARAEWRFDKRKRLGNLPKGNMRISERIKCSIGADGVFDMPSGKKVKLDSLKALIWKDLEDRCEAPAIVQHATEQLGISQIAAEIAVTQFILACEERELVVFY